MEQPSVDNLAGIGIAYFGHPDAGADRFPFRSAPQYRDRKSRGIRQSEERFRPWCKMHPNIAVVAADASSSVKQILL